MRKKPYFFKGITESFGIVKVELIWNFYSSIGQGSQIFTSLVLFLQFTCGLNLRLSLQCRVDDLKGREEVRGS